MSEPFLAKISGVWENTFSAGLPGLLDAHAQACVATTSAQLASFCQASRPLGCEARVRRTVDALLPALTRIAETWRDTTRNAVAAQQREISRTVVPEVASNRAPMYSAMGAERGTGTVERLRQRFLNASKSDFPDMYEHAAHLLERNLMELFSSVVASEQALHARLLKEVRMQLEGVWESAGDVALTDRSALRALLVPRVDALMDRLREGTDALLRHDLFAARSFLQAVDVPPVYSAPPAPADGDSDDAPVAPAEADMMSPLKRARSSGAEDAMSPSQRVLADRQAIAPVDAPVSGTDAKLSE